MFRTTGSFRNPRPAAPDVKPHTAAGPGLHKMSVALYSAGGTDVSLQSTTVGAGKPLHRFIRGQPKITGVIVLILGSSLFIVSIASTVTSSAMYVLNVITPSVMLGTLFIICGILYILTEHNPTKKTVTISLALGIVTILGSCWAILQIIPNMVHSYHYGLYEMLEDNNTDTIEAVWQSHYEAMGMSLEAIFLFYSFVGAIILIVMSALAGAALRSTKSQAIVVMTATPTVTPAE